MIEFFNPFYILIFQWLVSNLVLYSESSSYYNPTIIFIYINIPFIIYFFYYIFVLKNKFSKKVKKQNSQNDVEGIISFRSYIVSIIILLLSIICISFTLNYYIKLEGSFKLFLDKLKDPLYIFEIQRDDTFYPKRFSDFLSYFTAITSINILVYTANKKLKIRAINYLLIFTLLIIDYFYTAMIGSRILFIAPLFTIIFYFLHKRKFKFKYLFGFLVLVVACLYYIYIMQMNKLDETNRGYNVVLTILGNYYYESLKNGFYLIDRNFGFYNPFYWAMRPLLNIPIVTKYLGINVFYELLFGNIPILSRGDDFSYIAKLGIDPMYNTLSIYGYSFMDFSYFGILIILTLLIFFQKLYNKMIYSKSIISKYLFITAYIACLDELRTYSIFSTFFLYNLIYILILNAINKNTRKK